MTSRVEQVSNLTSASDVLSKFAIDTSNRQSCSQNKVYYRISRTAAAGSTTFSAFIPFKPPCVYLLDIKWQAMSTNGNVIVIEYLIEVNQFMSGGIVGAIAANPIVTQSIGGNSISVVKNATSDSLDVIVNNTPTGGTITETIEFEITSNKNF